MIKDADLIVLKNEVETKMEEKLIDPPAPNRLKEIKCPILFVYGNLDDPNLKEGASTLYNKFAEYWEDNVSKYVPKQKKFGEWMNKRKFQRRKEGVYYYYGLELLSEEYGQ